MGSFILLFGRTLVALAVVLLVVWGLSRLARRSQGSGFAKRVGAPPGARLEVLGRKPLSRTTSVAIVRVGGRNLVVGVTPQSVTLISEIPASELEPAGEMPADTPWKAESMKTPMAWDATISKLRELTVRR
ncbi:MAG: flagellar biosynthetic protein FliO [Acidimicrobiales bacterium]|jgi:flagellar biosynthetic protein FliO